MAFDIRSLWDVLLVLALVLAIAPWFGSYLGRVYMNRPVFGDRLLTPVESAIYRLLGTSPRRSMRARGHLISQPCPDCPSCSDSKLTGSAFT